MDNEADRVPLPELQRGEASGRRVRVLERRRRRLRRAGVGVAVVGVALVAVGIVSMVKVGTRSPPGPTRVGLRPPSPTTTAAPPGTLLPALSAVGSPPGAVSPGPASPGPAFSGPASLGIAVAGTTNPAGAGQPGLVAADNRSSSASSPSPAHLSAQGPAQLSPPSVSPPARPPVISTTVPPQPVATTTTPAPPTTTVAPPPTTTSTTSTTPTTVPCRHGCRRHGH